ncbi:hypothetical protein NHH88_05930 [Oxalobacteraceae bacterium OTU3CAMAD1]|nr:hypothetical protein NHH88_05930 [Oxalobacteraceae bacterium OTU3CAMAD1]
MNEALREHLKARNMLAHRYHATVHRKEMETDQLGEFLVVVAADDGQAKVKVKRHLLALGMPEAAGAQVYTMDVGNARMAELDTIYQPSLTPSASAPDSPSCMRSRRPPRRSGATGAAGAPHCSIYCSSDTPN